MVTKCYRVPHTINFIFKTGLKINISPLFPKEPPPEDDHAPFMEDKLIENNIPYEYKVYGDEENKLMHVFHCNIKDKNAADCNDAECAFFRKY